jgi:hypothetical protein
MNAREDLRGPCYAETQRTLSTTMGRIESTIEDKVTGIHKKA